MTSFVKMSVSDDRLKRIPDEKDGCTVQLRDMVVEVNLNIRIF